MSWKFNSIVGFKKIVQISFCANIAGSKSHYLPNVKTKMKKGDRKVILLIAQNYTKQYGTYFSFTKYHILD